jgi:hypothetical protein
LWLNLADKRWFAESTNREMRRSAHRNITDLEADVQAWGNEWNADLRPRLDRDSGPDHRHRAADCTRTGD